MSSHIYASDENAIWHEETTKRWGNTAVQAPKQEHREIALDPGQSIWLSASGVKKPVKYGFDVRLTKKRAENVSGYSDGRHQRVMVKLKVGDQGSDCYNVQGQIWEVMRGVYKESRKYSTEDTIPVWTDILNFMNTLEVSKCPTQYRFAFLRAKDNIGAFLSMYHEWKKGLLFSEVTVESLNRQVRAKNRTFQKLLQIEKPY